MSSIPSVVCAVDLSHRSAQPLQHAGAVAEHFRVRLIAVTVSPAERLASNAMAALVQDVLPTSRQGTLDCEVRVADGPPAAAILRVAHEEGADLLVIGTHGNGSFRQSALGSTTQAVLRHADLPVLVVPNSVSGLHSLDDRHALHNLGSVLAPIDFGPLSRRDARIANGIAETLGVPLLLVHVSPSHTSGCGLDPVSARAQLSELRDAVAGATPVEILAVRGEPADAIAAIASERNVGLLVMGLRGAGGANGPRPGSIAYRVLCATPTMLLALPPVLRRSAADSTGRDRVVYAV